MRRMVKYVLFLTTLLLAQPAIAAIDYWKADDVKAGMKGHGLTVFQGHKIEKFFFEVLEPSDDAEGKMITIRAWRVVNGKKKDLNIAAGMSGSPLYVDGKLLGAVAKGTDANPEGLVRPFEFMHEERMRAERFRTSHKAISAPLGSGWRKLRPGSSVKVEFISGDPDLSTYPIGTVTAVDDDGTVYLFGHGFDGSAEGPISYPAREGSVATTIQGGEAFKLSGRDEDDKSQRARAWYSGVHGVYATLDETAETAVLDLEVNTDPPTFKKKATCYVVYGNLFLGLSQSATHSFLNTNLEPLGEGMVDMSGEVLFEGETPFQMNERFARLKLGANSFSASFSQKSAYFGVIGAVLSFTDGNGRVSRMKLVFTQKKIERIFEVQGAAFVNGASVVRQGESISIAVQVVERDLRNKTAKRYEPITSIEIPENTPSGIGVIYVETGEAFANRQPKFLLPPTSVKAVIEKISAHVKDNSGLYVTILVPKKVEKRKTESDWTEMKPAETYFFSSFQVLSQKTILPPVSGAGIFAPPGTKGSLEMTFRIDPKASLQKPTFLAGAWNAIVFLLIAFPIYFFFTKLSPYADRAWQVVYRLFRKGSKQIPSRWSEFNKRLDDD